VHVDVQEGCDLGDHVSVDYQLAFTVKQHDLGARVGLEPCIDDGVRHCLNAMFMAAVKSCLCGYSGFRYSRDRNRCRDGDRTLPDWAKLNNVTRAAAHLAQATQFFRHQQRPPIRPRADRVSAQSSFLLLPPFFDLNHDDLIGVIREQPVQRIILRDALKRELALPADHPRIDETRAFLNRYDAAVAEIDLDIEHSLITPIRRAIVTGKHSQPARNQVAANRNVIAFRTAVNGLDRLHFPSQRLLTRIFS